MENQLVKLICLSGIRRFGTFSKRCGFSQRFYTTEGNNTELEDAEAKSTESKKTKSNTTETKRKKLHPYEKIHPWKSLEQFSESLVSGVIYNKNGLVAINKPYGISVKPQEIANKRPTGIVNEVSYTLSDAVPHITKELGYSLLKIIKTPEKYMSGIVLLAANEKVEKAVKKSFRRAEGTGIMAKTYWVVTTKQTDEIKGEMRLAMKMKPDPTGTYELPCIIKSWSNAEKEKRLIKIFNVQFNVISNATDNLSSLVQIKPSTTRWHAIRLFSSTILRGPILGDNICGSLIKNVMGTWVNINPYLDAAKEPPKLNKMLLNKLALFPGKEKIIPVHVHLRELFLPGFPNKTENLIITAPLMPEFTWTCKRLQFKHELFGTNENYDVVINDGKAQIVQAVG